MRCARDLFTLSSRAVACWSGAVCSSFLVVSIVAMVVVSFSPPTFLQRHRLSCGKKEKKAWCSLPSPAKAGLPGFLFFLPRLEHPFTVPAVVLVAWPLLLQCRRKETSSCRLVSESGMST